MWIEELPSARLVLLPESGAETVSVVTILPRGAGDDPPGKDGLAHLWEHVSYRVVPDYADRLGRLAGRGNAWTDHSFVSSWATAPAAALPELLVLELGRIGGRADDATVRAELPVIAAEQAERALIPELVALSALRTALWPRPHPEARSVLGETGARDQLRAADLAPFYEARPVIVIAGELAHPALDVGAIRGLIAALGLREPSPVPDQPPGSGRVGLSCVREGVLEPGVWLGWEGPPRRDADAPAFTVLASLLDRRLSARWRGAVTAVYETGRHAGVLRVVAPGPERARRARRLVRTVVHTLERPPSPNELERYTLDAELDFRLSYASRAGAAMGTGLCLAAGLAPDCGAPAEVKEAELSAARSRWLHAEPTVLLTGPRARCADRATERGLVKPTAAAPGHPWRGEGTWPRPSVELFTILLDFLPPERYAPSDVELWLHTALAEVPGVEVGVSCHSARCSLMFEAVDPELALGLAEGVIGGSLKHAAVLAPAKGSRRGASALRDHALDLLTARTSPGASAADRDPRASDLRAIGRNWGASPATTGIRIAYDGAWSAAHLLRLRALEEAGPPLGATIPGASLPAGGWAVPIPTWDAALVSLVWPAAGGLAERAHIMALAGPDGALDRTQRAAGESYGWTLMVEPDRPWIIAEAWMSADDAAEFVRAEPWRQGSGHDALAARGRLLATLLSWSDRPGLRLWRDGAELAAGWAPGTVDAWIQTLQDPDRSALAPGLPPEPVIVVTGGDGAGLTPIDVWSL